jgi:hypothetical protein
MPSHVETLLTFDDILQTAISDIAADTADDGKDIPPTAPQLPGGEQIVAQGYFGKIINIGKVKSKTRINHDRLDQTCFVYFNMKLYNDRLMSFQDKWFVSSVIHSAENMAKAGFFYNPGYYEPVLNDVVTCYACGRSIGGWNKSNLPAIDEHKRLVADCPLFQQNPYELLNSAYHNIGAVLKVLKKHYSP